MMVLLAFVISYLPFDICFNRAEDDSESHKILNAVVDVIFLLDIIITFVSACEDPFTGQVETNLKVLAKKYIFGWFWLDILAVFPFQYLEVLF
jgi:hypothetical protein